MSSAAITENQSASATTTKTKKQPDAIDTDNECQVYKVFYEKL